MLLLNNSHMGRASRFPRELLGGTNVNEIAPRILDSYFAIKKERLLVMEGEAILRLKDLVLVLKVYFYIPES